MTVLSTSFGSPFPEQVAALRLRLGNQLPTQAWDDLRHAEHDRAFVIAGAMKADLLADIAGAVDRAVIEHRSFDQFREEFLATAEKHNWRGWTGDTTEKGRAWRARVIYRTNMATSYAAGRMAQLVDGNFKFWVYKHGNAVEPRLQHLAWDGIALPPDHPFWETHAPPNGWGCTCRVRGANTPAGILRAKGDPNKALPDGWQSPDPKTGAPRGIDKGWDYAPGASVSPLITKMVPKLEILPQRLATDLMKSWAESESFAAWLADPKGAWPLVKISADDALAIGAKARVASLTSASVEKQRGRHGELKAEEYLAAQRVVDQATVRLTDTDPKTGTTSRIFILELPTEDAGGYVLVVKATLTGEGLFVTSMRRLSRDQYRRDEEINRLLEDRQRPKPAD
ncbi:MAG: phage minor head protein [Pseudomonadota bacterium]